MSELTEEGVAKVRSLFASSRPPKQWEWVLPTGVHVKSSDPKEFLSDEITKAFGHMNHE